MILRVEGLTPNTSYRVNVHNLACSNQAGGGHYQQEVGGAVDNINEIWQVMTTRSNGYGYSRTVNDFVARSEAQSVVIHNMDNTSLACADLSPIAVSPYTFGTMQIEELASFYTNETNVPRSLEAEAARYTGLATFYANETNAQRAFQADAARYTGLAAFYTPEAVEKCLIASADMSAVELVNCMTDSAYQAANPELMVSRRFVVAAGNVTGEPVSVDIEVLRNNYYNSLPVAQTDLVAMPVDIQIRNHNNYDNLWTAKHGDSAIQTGAVTELVDILFLRLNNSNYFHPGR